MATVTYTYPVTGTVPPTVAQALNENMLVATIVLADADTSVLVTHSWNTSLAQGTNLWPVPILYNQTWGTATVDIQKGVVLTNSVAVSVTKVVTSAGSGVGGTLVLVLMRPHSLIT